MPKNIHQYVSALPEIYQKIWGHPEFDGSSRFCDDRWSHIEEIVRSLQKISGKKNLQVLDLGCAQGYFCFALQELGCQVTGIDFLKENIEICEALKAENGLQCTFKNEKLTREFVEGLKEYDIVLCLSLIHHVCHEHGFEYARSVFEALANKAKIVVTELALKQEPCYWNQNLPQNYEQWFLNVAFFNEVAFFSTHLSEVQRPCIVFSNHLFYCGKAFYEFKSWKKKSYGIKPEDNNRRYYMSETKLMKLVRNTAAFIEEVRNEVSFLHSNESLDFLPRVLTSERTSKGILAVYEIKKGKLLMDAMADGDELDYEKIFVDLLDECVALEEKGFYHGDLRIWNVCVKDGKAFLIDFGNIQTENEDRVARLFNPSFDFSVYDAFLSLVYDVLTHKNYDSIRYGFYNLSTFFDFDKLGARYATFFKSCLLIAEDQLNFREIRTIFEDVVIKGIERHFSENELFKLLYLLLKRSASENLSLENFAIQKHNLNKEVQELINQTRRSDCQLRQLASQVEELARQQQNQEQRVQEVVHELALLRNRVENVWYRRLRKRLRFLKLK